MKGVASVKRGAFSVKNVYKRVRGVVSSPDLSQGHTVQRMAISNPKPS